MKYTPIENNKIETRIKARGTEWLIEAWMGRTFPCYSIFKARKVKNLFVWEGIPYSMIPCVPAKVMKVANELMEEAEHLDPIPASNDAKWGVVI